ncbi:MAG: Flp pilus assembly complex ATPase component TadA [Candidatus Aenigmarchaeota archaeon]|nr:Flp pilus assembly complex ATPase component TadA [Candidatus Aenigmarchaeota archaeon]
MNKIILDTSIIIDGKISEMISKDALKNTEIIIPYAVLDELQSQASRGREIGFVGLAELKTIRELCDKKKLKLRFTGERPSIDDIRLAKSGRMDALIRDVAKNENGTLYTADYVQALVGEAEGVGVKHIPDETKLEGLIFEQFFTPETLSVHLKEQVVPMAKRGKPGNFKLTKLSETVLTREDLEKIIKELSEATRKSKEGNVEIVRTGATVIQLGKFRISIARPPFSDGLEVTIVRPIAKLTLDDYKLSGKLMARLKEKAEGVVIAGPPGSGKSTLAASMAEFYKDQGKIVKTLESPRDLQVSDEITQYGPLEGDFEKTADILLLVRPDYSIYDEVRKTRDFEIFSDLRLAGVGMVGVVHASDPISAIQRFVGRVELGIIPHVLDTVVFVSQGQIKKVFDLKLTVKVPTGMMEADLARPVVEINDFETGKLEYEIYTFGEENVIIPVEEITPQSKVSPMKKLAAERIMQEIRKYDPEGEVEMKSEGRAIVRVDNDMIARLIGKAGATVTALEEKLGIKIDVEPKTASTKNEIAFNMYEKGNSFEFIFSKNLTGSAASVFVDDEFLFSATIGKKGDIRITKDSDIGKQILRASVGKKKIKVFL